MGHDKHSSDEGCFYCASDVELRHGMDLHDKGLPWDGRTIHMQTPESWCPYASEDQRDRPGTPLS